MLKLEDTFHLSVSTYSDHSLVPHRIRYALGFNAERVGLDAPPARLETFVSALRDTGVQVTAKVYARGHTERLLAERSAIDWAQMQWAKLRRSVLLENVSVGLAEATVFWPIDNP